MKTSFDKQHGIMAGVIVALVLLLGAGFWFSKSSQGKLQSELNQTQLESESLLSQKLALNKDIDRLRNEMNALRGRNTSLDAIIKQNETELSQKQAQLNKLISDNQSLQGSSNQIKSLTALRDELQKQIATMQSSMGEMLSQNTTLKNQLIDLQAQNDRLAQENSVLAALNTDNYRVDAYRGNKLNKLTVNSRRAKQINVSFDLPATVASSLNVIITTPDGSSIKSPSKSITFNTTDIDPTMYASTQSVPALDQVKRVEMQFNPDSKLKKGVYQVDVYSSTNTFIGRCQFKLK